MKKSIFILLTLLIVSAVGWVVYQKVNETVPNTATLSSVETFSIEELEKIALTSKSFDKFDNYIEKAINVKGFLTKMTKQNEKYILTISSKNGKMSSICNMQADQVEKIKALKVGDEITIKGIYKGYLIDMILLNCVII